MLQPVVCFTLVRHLLCYSLGTRSPAAMFHIVLHQPEIPDNAGNVGRTCVALGAKLWLVRPLGFRMDDRHLRRAGLDYWQHLDWEVVDDWPALAARLAGCRLWYFTKRAARPYTEAALRPRRRVGFRQRIARLAPVAPRVASRSLSSHSDGRRGPQPESGRQRGGGRFRGRPAMRQPNAVPRGWRSR